MKKHTTTSAAIAASLAVTLLAAPSVQAASPFHPYCTSYPGDAMAPNGVIRVLPDVALPSDTFDDNVAQATRRSARIDTQQSFGQPHEKFTGPVHGDWDPLEYTHFSVFLDDPFKTGMTVEATLLFIGENGARQIISSQVVEGAGDAGGVRQATETFDSGSWFRDDGVYQVEVLNKVNGDGRTARVLQYEFCGAIG